MSTLGTCSVSGWEKDSWAASDSKSYKENVQ